MPGTRFDCFEDICSSFKCCSLFLVVYSLENPTEQFWLYPDSNPELLDKKHKRYLSAMPPTSLCIVQKEYLLRNFFSRRFADFLTGRKTCFVGHAMAIFLVKWVEEVRSRPIGNLSRVFFNWSVKSLSFQSRIGIKEKKETTR